MASAVVGPSGANEGWSYRASDKGVTRNTSFGSSAIVPESGRTYRLEVSSISTQRYPKVRRSSRAFIVPYEKLSSFLQQIQRQGGKVANITPV